MFCSISGTIPEEPVVSKDNGIIFEKRLIEKVVRDTGKCPITHRELKMDDLLTLKVSKSTKPRVSPAASIPGLLGLLGCEWDSLAIEMKQLRLQLNLNRQELAHALNQHDAACRVIARLLRERDEAITSLSYRETSSCTPRNTSITTNVLGSNIKLSNKTKFLISPNIINYLIKKSTELSSLRKKTILPQTLSTPEAIQNYSLKPFLSQTVNTNITSMHVAPCGDTLLALGGHDGHVLVFDFSRSTFVSSGIHGKNRVISVYFFNDSTTLMSASVDGTVKLWKNIGDCNYDPFSSFSTHNHASEVVSALLHPSFNYIITVTVNMELQIWDINKAGIIADIKGERSQCLSSATCESLRCSAADVHPDGLITAIGTYESTIKLYDFKNESKEIASFSQSRPSQHTNRITDLTFSENGYLMSSSTLDGVGIWDLRKLQLLKYIKTDSPVHTVSYDKTGSYLALGSSGLSVLRTKGEYPLIADYGTLFHDPVKTICFGHDASFIAFGAEDNYLRILS
eukprot:gnl/TRDRNA2_/TRDRNA2_177475_c0_seq2.p1 gnl/TRDRNA2_/TRDRNA2_177475_c0~~gnl/TRDRNA2_/TRDRNA2_177475_c0_seq2.p1  ORF type:complete len:513 (-),score=-34.22 gnl/TRDRNA2_/TRDRNA2_177475_c0_seq2:248-1786(-)